LAPGFIDVHTHLEGQIQRVTRRFGAENFVLQGVTTVITGNCGRSAEDVAAFFRKLERLKLALNIATLVGHNTICQRVCGYSPRKPTRGQLQRMQSLVGAALEKGAVGFSTGLCYRPGLFAPEEEVVALVSVAALQRAVYATHIRDEGAGGMAALEEAVRTAQRAGAPKLHISHFKAAGRAQWGQAAARLEHVRRTGGPGLDVTADLYPYTAASSTLDYLLPEEALRALAGSARKQRESWQRAVDATLEKLHGNGWQDYGHVRVAFSERHKEWIGRTIPEIVSGLTPTSTASAREQAAWILKNQARGDIQIIAEEMNEQDVRQIITAPGMVFGSDSSVRYRGLGRPHPRGWGTFPRILGEYVRRLKLLALEEAVRRATSLPAAVFDLPERGLIREGFWADLVVFDPGRIADRATGEDPWRPPEGISLVVVNGVLAARDGKLTGALPGRPVRRVPRLADSKRPGNAANSP
jgi:N-acyl-D-amino-acid deacylase